MTMQHTVMQDRRRAVDAGRDRQAARSRMMRQRLTDAKTPEAAMGAAFDWARSSIARMGKPPTRTGEPRNRSAAERVMRDVTAYLARVAADIDNGNGDTL
jgi:hypothetical protein